MSGRLGVAGGRVALAALVFVVVACIVAVSWQATDRQVSDIALYHDYGEAIAGGKVPYRDFELEYPPGVIPILLVPALVTSTRDGYGLAFGVWMALWGVAGILLALRARALLGRAHGESVAVLVALALSPLLLGQLLLDRFDLVPATLTAAVLVAVLADRLRLAAALLGVAIAVKLYPAVLLPLLVAWAWQRRGQRAALTGAALTVGVALAAYLPFLVVAPDGVVESLARQLGRPLQIESLGAGVLLVLHQVTGMGLEWRSSHGSQNLTGTGATILAGGLSVAQLAALLWIWLRFARRKADRDLLVVAAAAAVVAFVALAKVISPQFLIWPLFLLPLLTGLRLRLAGGLYALACLLTEIWFPLRYWSLVKEFDPLASWLVLGRDVALVGVLAALLVPVRDAASRPEASRSRSPVPSPRHT